MKILENEFRSFKEEKSKLFHACKKSAVLKNLGKAEKKKDFMELSHLISFCKCGST